MIRLVAEPPHKLLSRPTAAGSAEVSSGDKLPGRDGKDAEKKNKWHCTCWDPTLARGSGRAHHKIGCVRKQWGRNVKLAFEPPHGTIVQMMETAGSKAGAFYKYNAARAVWAECEPPTAT